MTSKCFEKGFYNSKQQVTQKMKMILFCIVLLVMAGTTRCSDEKLYCDIDEKFCSDTDSNEAVINIFDPRITGEKSKRACLLYDRDFSFHNFDFMSLYKTELVEGGLLGSLTVETPAQFPHMVALAFYKRKSKTYQFNCAGSLISSRFVLTAAHCIDNLDRDKVVFVRLGSVFVPRGVEKMDSSDIRVKDVMVPESYSRLKKLNDIALIELEKSVFFSNVIKPICLYRDYDDPEEMLALGWGMTHFRGPYSDVLKKVTIRNVPSKECQKYYNSRKINITFSHLCAGNEEKNTCEGDSGGPLQLKMSGTWYIVGVTAFGDMCGTRMPGIFTRVSSFLKWIEDRVWPEKYNEFDLKLF